jgi:hypothetical protein
MSIRFNTGHANRVQAYKTKYYCNKSIAPSSLASTDWFGHGRLGVPIRCQWQWLPMTDNDRRKKKIGGQCPMGEQKHNNAAPHLARQHHD